jgi:L,D-transpeptidase ErfK/SrfK
MLKKNKICQKTLVALGLTFFLGAALATVYEMPKPGDDVVGENYYITVEPHDNLTKIRMRNEVSEHELLEANPEVNFSKLKVGQKLLIPMQMILPPYRHGIVLNMVELRLFYFSSDGKYLFTFPVGMGRVNWRTPTIISKIVKKEKDPTWFVPDSIRDYTLETKGELLPEYVLAGPKNPLGKYALYLQKDGYLIHGTNQPESVGTFVSSGCIRLWDNPIEMLYEDVPIGTPVYIIHHVNKAGWLGNKLYLETQIPVSLDEMPTVLNDISAETAIFNATKYRPAIIDWDKVSQIKEDQTGVPTLVGVEMQDK